MTHEAIIRQLWAIIDDIDTYGDMAKSDDKAFRAMVERRQKDRWKTGITTDGYTLNIPALLAVPLTDEQIENIRHEYRMDRALCFARAIEAAHGITKGQP